MANKLKVVRDESRNDPQHPNLVWAPTLTSRTKQTLLYANPATLKMMIDGGVNAKIGEFCGLVNGAIPGGDGRGLLGAKALFQGLKRPRLDHGRDEDILIYVTNPTSSFTYPHDTRYTAAGPARVPKPKNAIFTTFVEFGDRALEENLGDNLSEARAAGVTGVIYWWEWTLCSEVDESLPRDYGTRYLKRVW